MTQLMQLLEEARDKGDTDKIREIESEMFLMKKDKKNDGGEVVVEKGFSYLQDLL